MKGLVLILDILQNYKIRILSFICRKKREICIIKVVSFWEWIERLNSAVEYMEAHLLEKIDYEKVAEIVNCPAYHFKRMFFYMINILVSEYVRRRRMSLAAVDLQEAGAKVIDIALKYGYDSPTAFNRAFQSIHGIAPSVAKKENATLKSYPAIKFSILVQGRK